MRELKRGGGFRVEYRGKKRLMKTGSMKNQEFALFSSEKLMKISSYLMPLLFMTVLFWGCTKEGDKDAPKLTLKTGAGYTSTNGTIGKATYFKVGILAEKTKNDLLVYIVDYSINGGAVFNSVNSPVTPTGATTFETDITLVTQPVAGTEKWIFRVADTEGKLTTKEITLTVQ